MLKFFKLDLTISGYNRFIITCGNGITKIQHKDYKNFTTKEMMIPVILKLDKVNYSSVENILSHFQKYLILKWKKQ